MSNELNTVWVEIDGMSVAVSEPEDYLSPEDMELDQLSAQLDNYARIDAEKRRKRSTEAKARRRMLRR